MLKTMLAVSVVGRALASAMACRSDPVPWLPVVVTSRVDGTVRVSRSSTSKGRRRGFAVVTGLPARWALGRNHVIVDLQVAYLVTGPDKTSRGCGNVQPNPGS